MDLASLQPSVILTVVIAGIYGLIAGFFVPTISIKLMRRREAKRELPEGYDSIGKALPIALSTIGCVIIGILLPPVSCAAGCVLCTCAIIGGVIDSKMRIIPNELILVVLAAGIVFRLSESGPKGFIGSIAAFLGVVAVCAVSAVITKKLRGVSGVGAGDLKLCAAVAIMAGVPGVYFFAIGFAVAVIVFLGYCIAIGTLKMGNTFPMCPHLMIGMMAVVVLPKVLPLLGGVLL